METPIKTNMYYPLQDHIVIDLEANVLDFPRKDAHKCQHIQVEIDSKALELTCKKCGVKINPVMWIKDTMHYLYATQRRIDEKRAKLQEDEAELERRSRTRCTHCGKQTGINLKHHNFKVLRSE